MRGRHKKACRALNYFENFVFVSAISGCVSISAFAPLLSVPADTVSSAVEINIFAVTAGIKKYKSVIKKKRKKHDKINSVASKNQIKYNRSFYF